MSAGTDMSAKDADTTLDNAAHGGCPATICSACGGCTMLPGREEDDDMMNTPCWKCTEHAKLCGNCWHACQPFDVPPLGDHVHCNHPVIEVRDSPPYNYGWGTLRDARKTCPHWIPRQDERGLATAPQRPCSLSSRITN